MVMAFSSSAVVVSRAVCLHSIMLVAKAKIPLVPAKVRYCACSCSR